MSQILKSLEIESNSFNGTPETGSGAIFTSGSRLCFENDLGSISFLGGPGSIIVREYTGSNPGEGTLTYTWTKPSNINYIQVICVGAGGGGFLLVAANPEVISKIKLTLSKSFRFTVFCNVLHLRF